MDDIHEYFGTQNWTTYTFVFPLNIIYDDVDCPDEYTVLGQAVQSISPDKWEDYCERAHEAEAERAEESDAIGAKNQLKHRFSDSPNPLDRDGQTYWLVEIEALDVDYARGLCINVLRFLLGRINFAMTRNKLEGMQYNSSVWSSRWQDLRLPFIILIFADDEYSHYWYSTDPSPREPLVLTGQNANLYEQYFDEIPPLNGDRNSVENRLVKSVYSFQDAVTSTDSEDAFLDYWRGAERLTLTAETDTTSTVVQRARTVAQKSNVVSQSAVRQKRNKLVHEGESVEITKDDTNTVKEMLEELIGLYVDKADDWSHEDFLFFFEHAEKSDAALDQLEADRKSDIDMIEEIREMD